MRQKLKILFVAASLAIFIILVLFVSFELFRKKDFYANGGFRRNTSIVSLNVTENDKLPEGMYGVIGIYENRIYLQDFKKNFVVGIRFNQKDTVNKSLAIDLSKAYRKVVQTQNIVLDKTDGRLYINDGTSKILVYNLKRKSTERSLYCTRYFEQIFNISGSRIVLQIPAKDSKFLFALGTITGDSVKIKKINDTFFHEMVDDGRLLFNNIDGNSIFISYYKNPVYCFDSLINNISNSKLIDTVSKGPSVSFEGYQGSGRLVYTSPLRMCNPNMQLSGENLFIRSEVASNSDDYDQFKGSVIIDKYYTKPKFQYQESYFLPKTENENFNDFYIEGKSIFMVYNKRLLIYESSKTF